ncbi:MAG: PIN domain-containing protein [Actinobacteria bacterium]|nr:PIN domain-containing protein [Actinomycetota bacterium]
MIAYVDSSVLLRVMLGQDDALAEWPDIERGVVSTLVEVECLRTLDRLRVFHALPEEKVAARREVVVRLLDSMEVVAVTAPVLRRAAQPFPVTLGTLDALHLATALLWMDATGEAPVMATHDTALGCAARSMGLVTVGC